MRAIKEVRVRQRAQREGKKEIGKREGRESSECGAVLMHCGEIDKILKNVSGARTLKAWKRCYLRAPDFSSVSFTDSQ